jgi:hypothetical protein
MLPLLECGNEFLSLHYRQLTLVSVPTRLTHIFRMSQMMLFSRLI